MHKFVLSEVFKFELANIILSSIHNKVNSLEFYKVDIVNEKIYSNIAELPESKFIIPLTNLIDFDEMKLLNMFEFRLHKIHYIMGACLVDVVFIPIDKEILK